MKWVVAAGMIVASLPSVCAQTVPPPPKPVAEIEVRDGSIKMRSYELERVKRDSGKKDQAPPDPQKSKKISQIIEDFEKIQLLQDQIIEGYTKGAEIDYDKIGRSAGKMSERAVRLERNLFEPEEKQDEKERLDTPETEKSVRDLIVELDRAIGRFVQNPIFKDLNTVDAEASRIARKELLLIIKLSSMLRVRSEKKG